MEFSQKTLLIRIIEKLWLWRPILLFTIAGFVIFIILNNSNYTTRQIDFLQGGEPISKVEMKVVSHKGINNVVLTNRMQLDSIDRAFKEAEEKDIPLGGAFETWAEVNVYKGSHKINFLIQHSIYNGWMIEAGGKTLTSDYLFELVRRYARSKEKIQATNV